MAVIEKTSGSQTAVIGTEHTLATVTDAGIYLLRVDLGNMVAPDIVELRLYGKCRAATDTERLLAGPASYGPVLPAEKLPDSIPVVCSGYLRATLTQIFGTGRAFPWVILSTGA